MASRTSRRSAGRSPLSRWLVDGNNVFGSRPDGWWNDRSSAQTRLAQRIAEWCRTHDDEVVVVFDPPLADETALLAGGNLRIVEATRRGRDAADDEIVRIVADEGATIVVSSDRGLRSRLPPDVDLWGVTRFRDEIAY